MRLKSLELLGFKSFPDRTALDFGGGVTVVVGPNGSGKSNISDAIRWVLGELSAKSVRGTKMEDVIFAGTDSRKPLPFAEVSLTMDNTDDEGRIDSDSDEVIVTRRCYRNGESEYQINRRPVRLRDISELFMNTGIGKTGYSIIGQGRIAEILSQKSDERRSIFEEAAGISKYRYKKNEAERKLAASDENMTRLTDILGELTARLGPLEKESEKARRYLEIYEKKKRADVSLRLYELDGIRRSIKDTDGEYTAAKLLYEQADATLSDLEARSEKLFGLNQETKLKAERISVRVREYSTRAAELRESAAVAENDISHLKAQISDAETDLKIRLDAKASAEDNHQSLNAALEEVRGSLAEAESEAQLSSRLLDEKREKRSSIEAAQTAKARECETKRESIAALNVRLAAKESDRDNSSTRRAEIERAIEELAGSSELYKKRAASAESTLRDYDEKAKELKAGMAAANEAAAEHKTELERLTDELSKIKLDRASKRQRCDTLKRMDELFEGYSQSVRAVMRAAQNGEISGVTGPVSKIMSVGARLSVAIETAVGANIQNIVTDDEQSAKNAIAYLKSANAGRATFYPLTSIKATPLNMDEGTLKRYHGYVGIASALVSFDEKYRNIIEYMLGRTVVFDNLDNATIMARATGYRVRIVTLDGQLINAGGSFTGGSVKKDTGMLTRSAEIERIEREIAECDVRIKAREDEAGRVKQTLDDTLSGSDEAIRQLTIINTMYNAEKTQLEVLRSQLKADETAASQRRAELEAQSKRGESDGKEIDALKAAIEEDTGKLTALNIEAETLERDRAALASEIAKASDAYTKLSLKIAGRKKDVEAAEKSLAFSETTLSSLDEQIERAEKSVFRYNEAMTEASNRASAGRSESQAVTADIGLLQKELDGLSEETTRQDADLSALRVQTKEATGKRENLFREYSRLENKRAALEASLDRTTAKLWDEYELTYTSASELNYEPVTEQNKNELSAAAADLRVKLKALGAVNTSSIDEYKEVSERQKFLSGQLADLTKSRGELCEIIVRLENEMKERFAQTIERLDTAFNAVFRELFGGGTAKLKLTDPENILESGIDISVAPPGKIIKNLNLLSGGEQSFVAIALFFAILNINPTPFCVLDEIEAALDDVNVDRFADYARRYSGRTQFIIITHRRGTMERADTIYGVTMPERGISKILQLNVAEAMGKIEARENEAQTARTK